MIFMSQTGLIDSARERESECDAWYVEHLRIMVTVAGIASAQRFKTKSTDYPPSLAMYSVASAEVFRDPYYLSVRGMGEWLPLIQKQYYRRNLFEGLDVAPDVAEGSVLVIADRDQPGLAKSEFDMKWLKAAGIDLSTPFRGIAVINEATAAALATDCGYAVYRPVTPRNVQH